MSENFNPENPIIENIQNKPENTIQTGQETINTLFRFFDHNQRIKELIRKTAYPMAEEVGVGQSDIYRETLLSGSKQITELFDLLANDMEQLEMPSSELREKNKFIHESIEDIIYDPAKSIDDYESAYQKLLSGMSPKFIKEVSTSMAGYYLFKNSEYSNLIEQAHSFNELLHLAHSYLLSEESLFSKLPQWDQFSYQDNKRNINYQAVGQPNKTAHQIFSHFINNAENYLNDPNNHNSEIPTLLHLMSVGETTLIMIRDFGHALTIQVDSSDPQQIHISYQIPKIFDGTMVNKLPGVSKVEARPNEFIDNGTTGNFYVSSKNDIGEIITEFVSHVPTDWHH